MPSNGYRFYYRTTVGHKQYMGERGLELYTLYFLYEMTSNFQVIAFCQNSLFILNTTHHSEIPSFLIGIFSPRMLVKREIAKSRPESLPRPRARRAFFYDSCSKLEIDEAFLISHKLGLGLSVKFSKAFTIQLDRFEANTHPAQLPTHQKKLNWCGSPVPWTLSRTCAASVS